MRKIRQIVSVQYIWIDAICIGQSGPDEKSVQVPLMPSIYHKAENGVIWLGREEAYKRLAFLFIQELVNSFARADRFLLEEKGIES